MKYLLATIAIGILASVASSAPITFVLNTNTTINMVNVATNADVPYGSTTFLSNSLALGPTGTLFSADNAGNLWNVTGAPIPVGPIGKLQIGDLDYANNGLWGYSNASSELFFFDLGLTTVTYSQVISLPSNAVVTGVAHQVSTGDVFLSANNGLNNDLLLRVPPSSTSAIVVGPMAQTDGFSYISDIDFDASGTLYAMTWFHRYFYSVSTTTAATTFISAGPHRDTTGMALDPVPEPASVCVLLAGLGWLGRRRRS